MSIATVSRVINGTAPVAPETVALVQEAIAALNYRPRSAARMLASRKTTIIGLLFPDISGDFFSHLLRGIEAETSESGYNLLIYARYGGNSAGLRPQPLGEHNTDGVVVFVDGVTDAELARFSEIGFPVVLIHRSCPEGLNIPSVTIENKQGARKLVDHLIEDHGYRRIGFLAGLEGHEDSYWREVGYRESLAAHGIPFDPALISIGGFNRQQAHRATLQWLESEIEIDAIFAGDDESAIGVLSALSQAGVHVPTDIAVVGFDDTYLSNFLTPPLTTVHVPIEEVGREAIRQLLRLIQNETADPLVLLPTELVIRQSCGCD